MSKRKITYEEAMAVIEEHREAEYAKKVEEAQQYVGRFFKYRNAYSGEEKWWLYGAATGVDALGTPTGWTFQTTSTGVIEIDKEKPLYIGTHSGWREIKASEFWRAASRLNEVIAKRLSP